MIQQNDKYFKRQNDKYLSQSKLKNFFEEKNQTFEDIEIAFSYILALMFEFEVLSIEDIELFVAEINKRAEEKTELENNQLDF